MSGIAEIIDKLKKGESLNDDEKKSFTEFDLVKHTDGAQAVARKRAEDAARAAAEERDALKARMAELDAKAQAEADSKMSDTKQVLAKIAALEKKAADAETRAARLARDQRLDKVAERTGIKFVSDVDGATMKRLLVEKFADLDDAALDEMLAAEKLTEHEEAGRRIRDFSAKMKAVILDETGHGSGNPPSGSGPRGSGGKPIEQMTATEREKDLKKKGII